MSRIRHIAGPVCAALLMGGCATVPDSGTNSAAPIAETALGTVQGVNEGQLSVFRGIPYAAAPVGDLRWAAPKAATAWDGTFDATTFGPGCIQPPVPASSLYNDPPNTTSEDCLTLNIWAPKEAEDAPVIVWIHGGSLRIGAASLPMYDGANYAQRGAVFVSINYRLGPLGWLAHEGLSAESVDGTSGNYGLLDQIAALEWVRDNAAAFGGDPDNVTIMGESAGALSTTYLLVSPKARGLFDKAIIQSTNLRSFPELSQASYGSPSAEQIGAELLGKLDLEDIDAARAMDAQQLVNRGTIAGFIPQGTVDGKLIPGQLVDLFDRGEQARVPVLVGYNSQEYWPLRPLSPPMPETPELYEAAIRSLYGTQAAEFLRLYPYEAGVDSLLDATGDTVFGWSGERIAQSQAALGIPSYFYVFDYCYPSAEALDICAFHASELPFTFGNLSAEAMPASWPAPDGPRDRSVSDAMIGYWTSFAASGNPRAAGQPAWQAYGFAQNFMRFTDEPVAGRDFKSGMAEMLEAHARAQREAGLGWGTPPDFKAAPEFKDAQ